MTAGRAMQNEIRKDALTYAERFGWAVLPLHSIQDGRCSCGKPDCSSPGKHPRTKNGVKDASKDTETIKRWWALWPDANIGIATSRISGFFVLDVDGEEGAESLRDVEARHGKLPDTIEQLTGGSGRHLLFKMPPGTVKNKVALAPGLDVRGDGGYIVVAPSLHASGRRYTWEVSSHPEDVPLAEGPGWLLALVTDSHKNAGGKPQAKAGDEWQRLACTDAGSGERNHRLAAIVGHLLRRVNPYVARELALAWNQRRCKPPLTEGEVLAVVESIAGAELRRTVGGRV